MCQLLFAVHFQKAPKNRQYRCKFASRRQPAWLQLPLCTHKHAATTLPTTQRTRLSRTMMKMLCKLYGRSSSLRPIKPYYRVRTVCHTGPCESEQSLVTPSGIYQRFLLDGTVSLEENSFLRAQCTKAVNCSYHQELDRLLP